jgi:IclR family acetate operon transcriptional repressor
MAGKMASLSTVREGRGGVQSVQRAFELLELIERAGGEIGISEAAVESGIPLPTIHRLLKTLVGGGYVRQLPSRRYALGPRLISLGDGAQRTIGSWAHLHLVAIVQETGETANIAMLDGDAAIYVAQVPSRHPMRMFTEIGRRVALHSTGVGKVLLSGMSDAQVRDVVGRAGLDAKTNRTITTIDGLISELATIRERGYAVDDGEQELGVRCVAVPIAHETLMAGLSISGPESRIPADSVADIARVLSHAATSLSTDLLGSGAYRGARLDRGRPA